MNWKFWEIKKSNSLNELSKPKELPSRLGKHMVVNLKYDPDWVWTLKIVTLSVAGQGSKVHFRLFDPESTRLQGLIVRDFNTLNGYPDMIAFNGWYNKDTWGIEMDPSRALANEEQSA